MEDASSVESNAVATPPRNCSFPRITCAWLNPNYAAADNRWDKEHAFVFLLSSNRDCYFLFSFCTHIEHTMRYLVDSMRLKWECAHGVGVGSEFGAVAKTGKGVV